MIAITAPPVVIIPLQNRTVDDEHKRYGERIRDLLEEAGITAITDFADSHLASWKVTKWEDAGSIMLMMLMMLTYHLRDISAGMVDISYYISNRTNPRGISRTPFSLSEQTELAEHIRLGRQLVAT